MNFHIGEILLVAFNYIPEGGFWACDGKTYSVSTYQALFSLVGYTYGSSDGGDKFAVPNMTAPAGLRYLICYMGSYPPRP